MGIFSDMRRMNRVTDFAMAASGKGGAFETICTPAQVFEWLKAGKTSLVEETAATVTVKPVFTSGKIGNELITLQTGPGTVLPTRVVISVELREAPGQRNMNALPAILGMLTKLSKADPAWRPA
jgi:hypothetical protein